MSSTISNIFKVISREKHTIPTPLLQFFPNSPVCRDCVDFIKSTILERLQNESMSLWGKVGECEPPFLVLPLTIEPMKPRLCHDERFLNLWVVDKHFVLDTLREVPRMVSKDC